MQARPTLIDGQLDPCIQEWKSGVRRLVVGFADALGPRSGAMGNVSVELALRSAQELEEDHERDHDDAGCDEGCGGGDLPGAGEETCVDGVPIPKHLLWRD